jgi:hypothetical protein
MHHLHRCLLSLGVDVRSGEGRKFESLMLVLDGNIPRFPWEPSTTMLTYRLQGTTEATASNRNRHPSLHPTTPNTLRNHAAGATTSSLAPASTQGAL